ncbi:MAG TPA: hypothetical protein RMH85_20850 [Polyangiaceae bacterium LLY-WYZ-15_(1-7)]|nr:hypothetical protein [Polyangiaceae bacterium LLY-WYZ-15_(1-7)]HJL10936.1 hypothetical protein [Polyangiaceae bacterium LLY-WYZ-15_(1-7)]
MTRTLTLTDGGRERPEERPLVTAPQLVLAMDCAQPTARPARFSLAPVPRP